jgi:hypothetical protein
MDFFNPSTIFISKTFFSHENTKEIPLKTCRKEKYFLFLQQNKL